MLMWLNQFIYFLIHWICIFGEGGALFALPQLIGLCFSQLYLPKDYFHLIMGSQLSSSNLLLNLDFMYKKSSFSFCLSLIFSQKCKSLSHFSSNTVVLILTPGLYLCCSLCWNVNRYLLSKIIKNMAFGSQKN